MQEITYVVLKEQTAIEKGIIKKNHFFKKTENGDVIFKKDIITIWLENKDNYLDFPLEYIDTKTALTWT